MILPIVAYGNPVLRKKAIEIDKNYTDLSLLIQTMFETMEAANGIGLAAPQIGRAIRLFIVDASGIDEPGCENFKKVFVNPTIIDESGEPWDFEEGCLSIPNIRADVSRKPNVTITYMDENWTTFTETFIGMPARIIQHEYDHVEGILFVDKIHTLKKTLLKGRLLKMSKGDFKANYKMKR